MTPWMLLAVLLVPLACNAAGDAALRARVDATIVPLMARHDIPGLALGLAIDGRMHVFNYGVAARGSEAPVGDATIFEIGSVSKMFTTTLAALAQARGRLSLNEHPGLWRLCGVRAGAAHRHRHARQQELPDSGAG